MLNALSSGADTENIRDTKLPSLVKESGMEAENSKKRVSGSRRKMLKKVGVASAFAVPTLMTFKVSELHAAQSWNPGKGNLDHPGTGNR